MWQDLLQIHPIGIQDDFFELGGHSLLAVRLFAQVETAFGVRLPLTVLYQEATIEHLAEVIDRHASTGSFSSLVELQPQGTNPPFFCVHGITGDLLWFGDLARHLAPHQPFYGLESPALHSTHQPPPDIRSLATQYLALIRRKQPRDPIIWAAPASAVSLPLRWRSSLMPKENGWRCWQFSTSSHPTYALQMANPLSPRAFATPGNSCEMFRCGRRTCKTCRFNKS